MTAAPDRPAPLVVAVDGPSGSGKSSTARGAALRLGLRYLDTGAMYRALTWWLLQAGVEVGDAEAVAGRVDEPSVEISTDPSRALVKVDGRDVTEEIRSPAVTRAVSAVSAVPAVRARLVALQRQVLAMGDVVVEGRDIGTVVAPEAAVKVYLTADRTVRAERRSAELAHDPAATPHATAIDLARRDNHDSTREISPLVQADDAVVIDNSDLTLDEVVDRVVALVHERVVPAPPS